MLRFEVFASSTLIGHSELEKGDPPMGVAMGRFLPAPAYASLQAAVVRAAEDNQSHFQFSVRLVGGEELPAEGGVQILDFSASLGAAGLEIHVLGIGYPLYEQLFPSHVTSYEAQFPRAG